MVIMSAQEFKQNDLNRQSDTIDRLAADSFGHENISPVVDNAVSQDSVIGFIKENNEIVTSGFGKEDTYKSDYKYKTMYLHTFSTKQEFRGRGLCSRLINEFVKKYGKTHVLYLTVRTEQLNVNESAIHCYEKNGFILLPEVYRDHTDGKNNAMIRFPIKTQHKKQTKRKKKRKTKR